MKLFVSHEPIVFPFESYFVHMKDWSLVLNTAWVVLVLGPTLLCKSVLVVLHFKHPITNTYFCVGVWYWSTTKTLLHKSLRPPKSKLSDRPWFSQSSVMLCGCHYHAKACCRWYISYMLSDRAKNWYSLIHLVALILKDLGCFYLWWRLKQEAYQ